MQDKNIKSLVELRKNLIEHFERLRDYKSNKNALMKEYDHAELVYNTIVKIDNILKDHVEFS